MSLQFSCPNGHTITCNEKLAGKPAKCPQCGVKFVIPQPGQSQADPVSRTESAAEGGSGTGSGAGSGVKNPVKEETIAFLCPNGHRLNGPASLQGRAGQCPECGAKFRIPSYEDSEEDEDDDDVAPEAVDEEILTGEEVAEDTEFDQHDLEQIEIVEASDAYETFTPVDAPFEEAHEEYVEEEFPEEFVPTLPDFSNGAHALSGIFTLLWQQRRQGGSLELQLTAGELLSPDYFSPELSQANYGVFAVRAKDGTYTITTVPWESVTRVSLRKADSLPPGLFDE